MSGSDYVWVSPGRKGGEPCVGGSRIPVETIAKYMHSLGLGETLTAYPHITRHAALTACWFAAVHGPKRWRKRWGEWVGEHADEMWAGDWDSVPDPPGKTTEVSA